MDIFSKQLGPSYVPAFAGRLLVSMAKGIAQSKAAIKGALRDEEPATMWTLALIVVRWYGDTLPSSEAKLIAAALPDSETASILSNLNMFREQLLPFARTAHEASNDVKLAAAGVYFAGAVEQIGLSMLGTAMKSETVQSLQRKIQSRLPLPVELKSAYYEALGGESKAPDARPVMPPAASRSERFDRADFIARPKRGVPRTEPVATAQAPAASTPPPTPRLARADVTRSYLHTIGWEGAEVDQLLAGPNSRKNA